MKDTVHYLTMLLQNKISLYIIQKAKEYNLLPGQPKILEFLLSKDGCTPTEICKMSGLDKSTIAGILYRMKNNELIFSKHSTTDRRQILIYLTDKGRKTANDFQKELDLLECKLWGTVSEKRKHEFYSLIEDMISNLEEESE